MHDKRWRALGHPRAPVRSKHIAEKRCLVKGHARTPCESKQVCVKGPCQDGVYSGQPCEWEDWGTGRVHATSWTGKRVDVCIGPLEGRHFCLVRLDRLSPWHRTSCLFMASTGGPRSGMRGCESRPALGTLPPDHRLSAAVRLLGLAGEALPLDP